MKKINEIRPITSANTIRLLGEDLRAQQEDYYLIYRLILETGIPLSSLLDLTVNDLKDKKEIEVLSSRKYNTTRLAPLSRTLQKDLKAFLNGRSGHEYVFTSRFTGDKLHPSTFKTALKFLSTRHGLEPPVTVLVLTRTYAYNQYLKDPSTVITRSPESKYAGAAEYFGLDFSEEINREPMGSRSKTIFYKRDLLSSVRKKITKALKSISKNTERPDTMDGEYFDKTVSFLSAISDLVDDYEQSLKK